MAFHLTIDQVNTVSGGAYKTLEGTMNLVQALYLNNDVEPFDNEKVRQAMCYAVNVEEILNLTGEGHGKKLGSSIYPALPSTSMRACLITTPMMWRRQNSC